VHVFPARDPRVLFAIPATYQLGLPTRGDGISGAHDLTPAEAIDPLVRLALPPPPPEARASSSVLRVGDGEREICLVVGGAVRADVAARLCPSHDESTEIVRAGGGEAILIRPLAWTHR
jgi:hypothetical protein